MNDDGPDRLVARPGSYTGRCVLTRTYAGLHVDRADPQALISTVLLNQLRAGRPHHPAVSLDGDLLRIEGTNRTVIYRIGGPAPNGMSYYMAWPD